MINFGKTAFCNRDFTTNHKNGTYLEIVEKGIKEALEWYSHQTTFAENARSAFCDRLQDVILSRMYLHRIKESGNFHWHIVISEVHPENEKDLHTLYTNHNALLNDAKNVKEVLPE